MPTVYRIVIRATRGEQRGKYRVMLFAKEGAYSLSVPRTVLGKLLYKIVKQRPLTIQFGRGKNALQLKAEDLNLKGIRPIGKTASQVVKYVPLRLIPPEAKEKRRKKKNETATTPQTTETTPTPKILEVTSAVFPSSESAKEGTEKGTAKSGRKGGKKKAVATAV